MDGKTGTLQERWLGLAETAYRRMFEGKSLEELVTLTQREDAAVAIAKELAAFLLEEHVALDSAASPTEASAACCPKCGQAGTLAEEEGAEFPERTVTTRVGDIRLRRQRWCCAKCRIFFFPLDGRLRLGTEGFSPSVLKKAVRQASQAASFAEASADLRELAEVELSPTHLQRLSQRIGREWVVARDADVEKFRQRALDRTYKEPPRGATAVMLDGGRAQTRADDSGRGVTDPRWRESKVACCLTLSTKAQRVDPEPEPPAKFLEPTEAARLAAGIKRRSAPTADDQDPPRTAPAVPPRKKKRKKKNGTKPPLRRRHRKRRPRIRTVVATMENSETFGWQVAAEVHRRGLDQAKRKACVCDGQAYNWSIFEMHLRPAGFIPILDFVHLLAYLYDAAHAFCGADEAEGWKTYGQWLREAWSGKVDTLLAHLRTAAAELGRKGKSAAARHTTVAETLTYVTHNRERMDYPEYRRLGLPTSSAPVESTIKQLNRRVKGSEKFWLEGGVEAMLQLRSALLSDDDRWHRNWSRPRPHRRAVGSGRLAQAA